MRTFLIVKKDKESKEEYISGVINSKTYPSMQALEKGVKIIEIPTPEQPDKVVGCHISILN